MKLIFLLLASVSLMLPSLYAGVKATIVVPGNPGVRLRLAAHEVRRYFYLRTSCLAETGRAMPGKASPPIVFVLCARPADLPGVPGRDALVTRMRTLGKEDYLLETISRPERKIHVILGGGDAGVLYGAYAFAEQLGVRFYLDGDVVPGGRREPMEFSLTSRVGRPIFEIRGIQPFHDFPEGPDWWTGDDYKAVCSQLVKLKMNFLGLHTYPEGGIGPEPLVWIGREQELNNDGTVKSAYPARHFATGSGIWGYAKRRTSAFSNRLGDLFDDDYYGTSYMKGIDGWPAGDRQEVALFNRTGAFFHDVFAFARDLGIKTCVGTETPLVMPGKVKERLAASGIAPDDSAAALLLYRGVFEWVKRNYPIDYYWFWTPEDWTWRENTAEELARTRMDLNAARKAANEMHAPFTLATCGWVLGPANDRSYFDEILPKNWPMSCINRYVGFEPIEAGFARSKGRPLWAIPWLEDDPGLLVPQLWAGRMRRDAIDAAAYGCTGLIGIHWRTRILGPNVSALASSAWDQPWNPRLGTRTPFERARERKSTMNLDFPVDDFYLDWAAANFGKEKAGSVAAIFARLDGGPDFIPRTAYRTHLPRPADWKDGPGGVQPDSLPWAQRAADYSFIDTLEQLRNGIKEDDDLERYDYWLGTFRYLRAVGKFACTQGEIERLVDDTSRTDGKGRAQDGLRLLSLRTRQIREMEEALTWLIKTITTSAELGTIANWQQHVREVTLERTARKIEQRTGRPLPEECWPGDRPLDAGRMIIPTVRSAIRQGEALTLRALFYGDRPRRVVVQWRDLGKSSEQTLEFHNVARNVYEVSLPASLIRVDLEYRIVAEKADGTQLLFPAAANAHRTVVVY